MASFGIKEITRSSTLPISLNEAKAQVKREGFNDDDGVMNEILAAVVELAEKESDRTIVPTTFDLFFDNYPAGSHAVLRLPVYPITEITSIKYLNEAGVLTTMPDTDYQLDLVSTIPRVRFIEKPTLQPNALNRIQVRIVAGYTGSHRLPNDLKKAMLQLFGYWYQYREDFVKEKAGVPEQFTMICHKSKMALWTA